MSSPFFFIVVPVYKAETFVGNALDSLLKQTFSDFCVVAVDDGSPDRSGSICDEYAARDSRIHVIHQSNAGAFAARAAGIRWCLENGSQDSFLMSLDADDIYYPHTLQTVYDTIQAQGADLVVYAHDWLENGKYRFAKDYPNSRIGAPPDRRTFFRWVFLTDSRNGLCSKAVSLRCIQPEDLEEKTHLRVAEDLLQSIPFYCRCRHPYFLAEALLVYVIHSQSVTNSNTYSGFINPFPAKETVWDAMQAEGEWSQVDFADFLQANLEDISDSVWRIARMPASLGNKVRLWEQIQSDTFCRRVFASLGRKNPILQLFVRKQYILLHFSGSVLHMLGNIRRLFRKL